MPHVVTGICKECRYTDCVVVCPVEAFYVDADMVYIHPHDCDDCEACVPECPIGAIYFEPNVPPGWASFVQLNLERAEVLKRSGRGHLVEKDEPRIRPGSIGPPEGRIP